MDEMSNQADKRAGIALKAGLWYTVCNFINKGIAFLATPIFVRILTKSDMGEFSNFLSWLTLLTLIITMDMHVTVSRARYDFPGKIEQYSSSITILSAIVSTALGGIMILFRNQFTILLSVTPKMLYLMVATIVFSGAFQIFQIRQRLDYKYKMFCFMTLVVNLGSIGLSLLLIFIFPNKLEGRLWGYVAPHIIVYVFLFVYLVLKGRNFSWNYSKYCLKICLPYIPHLIAINILSISDRVMIKHICGAEATALYTIGYNCAIIVMLLATSLNQAWAPWLSERLHEKNYKATRKRSKQYIAMFAFFMFCLCLIGPEVVLFMGGKSYADAIYILPPVIVGCTFQFVYMLYVNIETFEKKTYGMACATVIAAAANVILNYLFIPIFGYIAAAFTTLVGYAILMVMHYFMVKRLKMTQVYETKFIVAILGLALGMIAVSYLLYLNSIVRYIFIFFVAVTMTIIIAKNKKNTMSLIKMILPSRK